MIKAYWWKILSIVLLLYTCTYGFLVEVPRLDDRMQESIRNFFFHVPMWFGMMILLLVSLVYTIKYLRNPNAKDDYYAVSFATTGTVFGLMGLITGAIWANYQWGQPWSGDPKQNGAAVAMLIYLAYFVLRGSMNDEEKRARISAVYNVFAFFMLFPTLWILPRLTESLHPGGQGSEGNPGINGKDLAPSLKIVFWPAVLGWTLLGVWISTLKIRTLLLTEKLSDNENTH
ncbi:MAG: cytochrome c biogenesis protein CcsA [Chitinophagaceae bacterium]